MGAGKVLAIYSPTGSLRNSFELAQLFSAREIATFPHSVSSVWWRPSNSEQALITYVNPDQTSVTVPTVKGPRVFQTHARRQQKMEASSKIVTSDRRSPNLGVPGKKGMTWGKGIHDAEFGTDFVSCHGSPRVHEGAGGGSCNPYQGDTSCSLPRPILCIKTENLPRPNYAVPGESAAAMSAEYYYGWAGGHIGLTEPIVGTELTSLDKANQFCESVLGKGYRMAEHHDGKYVSGMGADKYFGTTWPSPDRLSSGGWAWRAYGDIPNDSRFWVYINDQPGNCWNSAKAQPSSPEQQIQQRE